MGHTRAANAYLRVQARGLARLVSSSRLRASVNAEPLLRRAVPLLIVVFLAAVAAGAFVQIFDDRRQAIADTEQEFVAACAGRERSACASARGPETETAKVRAALTDALPARAHRFERRFIVTDSGGRVIAAEPAGTLPLNEHLTDLLGTSRALAMLAGSGEAFPLALRRHGIHRRRARTARPARPDRRVSAEGERAATLARGFHHHRNARRRRPASSC
jgi:two-component system, cell cycle sensor histidine kinase PleC